jgi:hypothetical protein
MKQQQRAITETKMKPFLSYEKMVAKKKSKSLAAVTVLLTSGSSAEGLLQTNGKGGGGAGRSSVDIHCGGCKDRRHFFDQTIKAVTASFCLTGLDPKPSLAATQTLGKIAGRLESTSLVLPPPSSASELNGIDNTYYPDWLEGEWDVTQTLVDAQAPLGLKFVGGPNGLVDIAEKTMKEAKSKVSTVVALADWCVYDRYFPSYELFCSRSNNCK